MDAKGNVYIADQNNYRIRRVGPDGIITTFAGKGEFGYSGDGGPATQASLKTPRGIAVDARGNVYIADPASHCIRRVGPDGIITTFAGTGGSGFSGDGGSATQAHLANPNDVAVDARGNVYIADTENNRIRLVGPDGIITTFAGTGPVGFRSGGFSGDGGPAIQASLKRPNAVAVDANGVVYIADTENHRIRRVSPAPYLMLSASSLPLDSTKVGATAQKTFILSNPGWASLSVTGITVTGRDSSQFKVSPATATIPAGDSLKVTVVFTPTSAGVKSATLSIAHNAAGIPSSVALTGAGLKKPDLALRPDSLGVRNVATGATVRFPLTLYNRGSDTLRVASVTSNRKEFAVALPRPELVIAPGDSQTVMVAFTPSGPGDLAGSLTVSSNDPDRKALSIPVSGAGVPLTLSADLNPAEGDQNQTSAGGVKPGKKVTVQVFVKDAPQIKGFTVRVAFDSLRVKFVPGSFAVGPVAAGLAGLANPQKDYVEIGGAALGSGTGGGSGLLGTLAFEAQPGFEKEAVLRIPLMIWNRVTGGRQEIQTDIQVALTSEGGALTPDFDGDGEVGFSDFFEFAAAFGKKADGDSAKFDLDGDGEIGFGDFFAFAAEFGKKK